MNEKKIIFIVAHFHPLSEGVGNATLNLCRAFAGSGQYQVEVITPKYSRQDSCFEIKGGIKIWRIGGGKYLQYNILKFLIYFYFFLQALYIILKRNPQIIFAQTAWESGVISAIAGKLFNIISIVHTHGHPFFANRIHSLARFAYKNNKIVLATNRDYIQFLKSNRWVGKNKLAILPNVYFQSNIIASRKKLRRNLSFSDNFFHLIFVGRLALERGIETKGLSYAIKAMKNLKDCVLHVFGDGPLKNQYMKFVSEIGLSRRINFKGKIKPSLLYKNILAADALLMPSLNEGLSMTMIEAMSARLPVIITKTSGAIDYINDSKNGLFIKKKDTLSIVNKINRLKNNKKFHNKIKINSYLTYKAYFSPEKIVEKFNKIVYENYSL